MWTSIGKNISYPILSKDTRYPFVSIGNISSALYLWGFLAKYAFLGHWLKNRYPGESRCRWYAFKTMNDLEIACSSLTCIRTVIINKTLISAVVRSCINVVLSLPGTNIEFYLLPSCCCCANICPMRYFGWHPLCCQYFIEWIVFHGCHLLCGSIDPDQMSWWQEFFPSLSCPHLSYAWSRTIYRSFWI